jgi:adenylate cyclase
MGIETERKFLVKGEFKHLAVSKIAIIQRYLLKDPYKTIRLRIADAKAFLTIKTPLISGSIARGEWEFQIPVEDANELMKICLPGQVIKTRYIIPAGKHKFEVDEFHDKNKGLVIAEIELESEDQQFEFPDFIGEEVTGNPAYYNSNLAR